MQAQFHRGIARNGRSRSFDHRDSRSASLAVCYAISGDLQKALQAFDHVHASHRDRYGNDHPNTQRFLANLAQAMKDADKQVSRHFSRLEFENAETLLRAMEKHHGPHKHLIGDILQKLHVVLLAQKEYADALTSIDKWVATLDSEKQSHQELLAYAKTSKAVCYLELDSRAQAEQMAKDALTIAEIDPINHNRCQSVLGVCLADKQQFEDGEILVIEAFARLEAMREDIPTELSWVLRRVAERVVTVYEMANKQDEAAKWKEKLKAIDDFTRQ